MADKKITDLTLVASAADDLSLPVDDGTTTYRSTFLQIKNYILSAAGIALSMLALDIFSGLSAVTPADDDYVPLVDTSDSNKTKKGLVSSLRGNVFRAVTSTDTCTNTDNVLSLSGASFTETLFTAVGNAGKKITFIHAGTSLTDVYTIATTSSQTVGGLASGVWTLTTSGEVLTIVSDGSNWNILNRNTSTGIVDAGAITIGAITTAPTKGTTNADKVTWYRFQNYAVIKYLYQQAAAGSAGSGNYLFSLPTGLAVDTSVIATYTGATNLMEAGGVATYWIPTKGHGGVNGSGYLAFPQCFLYSSTQFRVGFNLSNTTLNNWGSAFESLGTANLGIGFEITVPIDGWQP